jgi:hypothetical protein
MVQEMLRHLKVSLMTLGASNEFKVDGHRVITTDCMPRVNLPVTVSGTLDGAGSVVADRVQ